MNSKKIFLSFLFIGILAMQSAYCQTTNIIFTSSCAYSSDEAVGRVSSDGNHIISYHSHLTYGEFLWTNTLTNNYQRFQLPNDIFVHDFERIGDTIFFCGHQKNTSVVGYLTESVFTSGIGNVYFAKVPEILYLTKMEVYANQNNNHVVAAIGYEETGFNQSNTGLFIFEFVGSGVTYDWRTALKSNSDKYFIDVAVTPQCIVTVGIYDFMNNQAVVTITSKTNTTILSPYYFTETAGNLNSVNYSIEYLEDEEVAISTLVFNTTAPTLYLSPVHVFDASTTSFANSQTVPLLEKSAPYNEMKYFPDQKTLILLQTNQYPTLSAYNSVFYYLEPYNTSIYTALATFDNDSYYYSLDRFSKKEYLATGEMKILSHSFMTHNILSTPAFQCLTSNYHRISNINKPVLTYISTLYTSSSYSILDSFHVGTVQNSVQTKCNQP